MAQPFDSKGFAKRLNPDQQKDFSALTRNTGGNFKNLGGEQGLMKRYGVKPQPVSSHGPGSGAPPTAKPLPKIGGPISPPGGGNLPRGPVTVPPGPLPPGPEFPPAGPIGPAPRIPRPGGEFPPNDFPTGPPIDPGGKEMPFDGAASIDGLREAAGIVGGGMKLPTSLKVIRGY